MATERWQQIEELYHAALEHAPERRAAFLAEACADDADLRREVEELLRYDGEAETFMQNHALVAAAQQLDSEALSATQTLLAGQQLGAYQILAPLGKGGMGEVHLALDTRLQRKVALKLLPAEFTANAERVRRFAQEARAAAALNHPNILTIYDIGEHEHLHYIVTEFVEGETLRQRMTTKQPRAATIAVVAQIAEALAAAHEVGIIHRDIKPENVMLRRDDYVKVLDFGLAKLTEVHDPQGGSTASGVVMGTPRYMSPEQARGEKVDARSDIFSLGVMLYEMLAGRAPFTGATSSEVIAAILRDDPAPLSDTAPELQHILHRALQKGCADRYPTMRELLADLKRLQRQLEREEERDVRATQAAEEPTVLQPQTATAPTSQAQTTSPPTTSRRTFLTRRHAGFWLALIGLVIAAPTAWFYLPRAPVLTAKDTILLADFENQTGDAVFDGMLKQGLAIQLQQTPFLTLLPEAQMRHELTLMKRQPNEQVTAELARQICERKNLKAFIAGSIAPLGNHYVLALEALNGQSGESLAQVQTQVESKEKVLQALSQAATELRSKLGESLSSIQRFDRSLQEGTTAKPGAFKAYAQAIDLAVSGQLAEAIPFYQRAIELDSDFAHAYSQLGIMYFLTGQPERATDYVRKSFELRERAGEIEKSRIIEVYHRITTGDLNKSIEALTLHRRTYPREYVGPTDLASCYNLLGQSAQALTEAHESIRLNPNFAGPYAHQALALLRLHRFAEAKETLQQAFQQGLEMQNLRALLYQLSFINHDRAAQQQQLAAMRGKAEHLTLDWQAQTAAFAGEWRKSQEFARQAIALTTPDATKEMAARYASEQALCGALFADCRRTLTDAAQSLQLTRGRITLARSALGLALCGEVNPAKTLADELSKRYPEDTVSQVIWRPLIQAALELQQGRPTQAIEQLQTTSRYEAAAEFWPQYLRGQAYWQLKQHKEAAAEFQKILDHRGYAPLSPLYPLAQLGLARATQQRKAYDDFFALWKEADAELPALRAARQEAEGKRVEPPMTLLHSRKRRPLIAAVGGSDIAPRAVPF